MRGEHEAVRFEIWHALMERTGRSEEIVDCLPKPGPLTPTLSPDGGEGGKPAQR